MLTIATHGIALGCVLAVAVGQVLFKQLAVMFRDQQTVFSLSIVALALSAATIYLAATAGWIWLLQYVELSKVYPYFAASFIVVPLGGILFFGEKVSLQYVAGIALIVAGVLLTTTSRA